MKISYFLSRLFSIILVFGLVFHQTTGKENIHNKPSTIIIDPNLLNSFQCNPTKVLFGVAASLINSDEFDVVWDRLPVLFRPFKLIEDGRAALNETNGMYNIVRVVDNKLVAHGYDKLLPDEIKTIVKLLVDRFWVINAQTKKVLEQAKSQGAHLILATNQDAVEFSYVLEYLKEHQETNLEKLFDKIFIIPFDNPREIAVSSLGKKIQQVNGRNPSQEYFEQVVMASNNQNTIWFMGHREYNKFIKQSFTVPPHISIVVCDNTQLIDSLNQFLKS